tara:strand:- start:19 stop:258 length:240 start_codon:yes stop_codon:yes gene_type:complete
MIIGQNKLDEEFESAKNIPEKERFIIDKSFLRHLEEQQVKRVNTENSDGDSEVPVEQYNPAHEVIAEHYDKGKTYFAHV